jgi:hypothetical protein
MVLNINNLRGHKMNKLTRSTALKVAAVIVLVLALADMIVYEIPDLMRGMATVDQVAMAEGGPPFFMVLLSFAMDVLAIVAAYGAWRAQRWGVILVIVISAFNSISGTFAAIFAPEGPTRIISSVAVVLSLSAIFLCLRREHKPLAKSV